MEISLKKGNSVDGISTQICKDLMLSIPNRIVLIYSISLNRVSSPKDGLKEL